MVRSLKHRRSNVSSYRKQWPIMESGWHPKVFMTNFIPLSRLGVMIRAYSSVVSIGRVFDSIGEMVLL